MRLLLIAALAFPAPASADDEWDSKETREVQAKFGACVVKNKNAMAKKMVLDPNPDEGVWRRGIASVGGTDCLFKATEALGSIQMKFPMDTMRYALADALVRREFSTGSQPSIKDAAPLTQPTFDEAKYQPESGKKLEKDELKELDERRAKRVGLIFLAGFGECVVRANPGKSHALLMTQPTSPGESAAFKALTSEFAGCLTAGQQLSFGKTPLRGTIAMNYYRLAHAPRVGATPAGASK